MASLSFLKVFSQISLLLQKALQSEIQTQISNMEQAMIFLFALPRTQTAREDKSTCQKERTAMKTALD
ncbi:hypothetical protein [Epibacterium ulvae]|uniref:hypothetical protein n=1 Tax=Epibacterium ulvae TaxID=1156985 RepID=UPI002490536C|nr:hypothetical protein [Epibacterium ulvae]